MADTFKKDCGDFTIEVSPPWPRWVRLFHNRHGDKGRREEISGFSTDDLPDLKYLVDRAISEVEKLENAQAARAAESAIATAVRMERDALAARPKARARAEGIAQSEASE